MTGGRLRTGPDHVAACAVLLVLAMGSAAGQAPKPAPEDPAEVSSPDAGSLAGRVVLVGGGGRPEPKASGAVVYLPGVSRRVKAVRSPVMTSSKKAFEPHVISVPEGTSVEFPNLDKIYHNAFSLSSNCKFDLGLYKNGTSRAKTFDTAGVCRVYCNIHVQMSGIVLVTKGDASVVTGPDGGYRIDNLPPGRRLLRVWHERGGEVELSVEVVAGRTVNRDVHLDLSGYRQLSHTRKDGTSYGKDDEIRY